MRSWLARVWFSSMLTFTRRTLPLCARTTFSRMGVSCLQGPHQGAQKSTSTGRCREASSTSLVKVATVAFLTRSPAAGGAAPPGLPNPNTMFLSTLLARDACVVRFETHRPAPSAAGGYRHGKDARLVPAGTKEKDEVVARDVGGRRVLQRVIVEPLVAHHIRIENDRHAPGFIVDEREGGN